MTTPAQIPSGGETARSARSDENEATRLPSTNPSARCEAESIAMNGWYYGFVRDSVIPRFL